MNYLHIDNFNDKKIGIIIPENNEYQERKIVLGAEMSIGSHGELILITEPGAKQTINKKAEEIIIQTEHAYENFEHITLEKEDAKAILDMLNDAIKRLESGQRDDNDIEVFGERALAYERLIDRLNGELYESGHIYDDPEYWKNYNIDAKEYLNITQN